ncbi:hypothetical protein [Psychrosphaera haliotis]|uniref:hypothetical protein n=1 Tax=Psychrosphaera haliotis TaxID=555083 RepID=UPI0031D9DB72
MKASNLWILTEERPKDSVIGEILQKFAQDHKVACFIDNIKILPILNKDKSFSFTYVVKGFDSQIVKNIYIKTVSGYSSFVDFLIFYQDDIPDQKDTPIYAIEETKTDDAESRNTGVYQRASKFPYIEYYYPSITKIMLYSLQIEQKQEQTDTNVFGTKCLHTIGVSILGKRLDEGVNTPWDSIDEMVAFKNGMKQPPKGNVPVRFKVFDDKIQISGRLIKSGSLSYDPNIGQLSLMSSALRSLGWSKKIEITMHGLEQRHIENSSKFLQIADRFDIDFEGLIRPEVKSKNAYWRYDLKGEKLGTIFIHLVVENFTSGFSIYENHAGCERGYFMTEQGEPIVVGKYLDQKAYKSGDKKQIIHIPDLVLADIDRKLVINVEGKKYSTMQQGIDELSNFDGFELHYIKKHFPEYKEIIRTVVLFGSKNTEIEKVEVSFLLNDNGKMILNVNAPKLFQIAIRNLINYWRL